MDPNHWNTYNFQYGAAQGGLTPTHPSLGLSLSHGLQGTHGPISGRSMSAIPSVNYSGLSVPILDSMAPLSGSIQPQQAHKSMSIGEAGQIVFDPQGRSVGEQLSPSLSRYDGNKVLRTEALSRNQLLEAARVWGGTNFSSTSSLYNQYSAILPEVAMPVGAAPISSSPSIGNFASSKSSQSLLQEPPPAHSSGLARGTSCQRAQSLGDLIYSRSSENLIPSSLSLGTASSYSSGMVKDIHSSNQQQGTLHHRQTPASQTLQGYMSSHRDGEGLSASAQHQLYGSYSNIASVDSPDFTTTHMSNDIPYEAVSPAPTPVQQETATPAHMENSSFSVVQFPEFANLAPEHAQALADKFQESDFRLKLDPMRSQQSTHDALSFHQGGLRQELKLGKDSTNQIQSLQINQQSSPYPHMDPTLNITQSPSSHLSSHNVSLALSSMQQQIHSRPTVQAPADSTTNKPKRVRNRKKKGDTVATTAIASITNTKKSMSQASTDGLHRQQHMSNLHMTPSSQISTLPLSHSPLVAHENQQQQQRFPPASNQYPSRDAQRAQTPSVPQNYSMSEHQQGYTHSPSPLPSPKIQNNPAVLISHDFAMSSQIHNEKPTYKSQHRKPKESSSSPTVNQNNNNQPLYNMSNIPNNQMNLQNYPDHNALMNLSGQSESPVQNRGGHISRLNSFPSVPAQHQSHPNLGNTLSNMNQLSPQESISRENKHHTSSQYLGNFDPRQSGSSQSQSPLEMQQQQQSVVMNHAPPDPAFESRGATVIIDSQDPNNQFQVDFTGQPFLEQLVNAQNPSFVGQNAPAENGVMLATLVSPAENAQLQEERNSEEAPYSPPTYQGQDDTEIHSVGPMCGEMNMEDMSFNGYNSQNGMNANQASYPEYSQVEVEPMTLTYMPSVIEDDEFNHFSHLETAPVIKKEPGSSVTNNPKKDSFQTSFLSYLQGNKQETLSSVSSSAITKKPQLPKYIPEPRRPKPVNITVLTKDPPIPVADAEDNSQGKDFLSTLSLSDNDNSSQKSESDKEGYIVQRTSELAMKITLPKGIKRGKISTLGESSLLSHNKKHHKEEKVKIKRKRGKRVDSDVDDYFLDEQDRVVHTPHVKKEPTPPPARTSIGRKAKERCNDKSKKKRKYAESGSSSEDEIFPKKMGHPDLDKDYDSDKDPVWQPFEQDLKVGYDLVEKKKKTKRVSLRAPIRAPPPTTPRAKVVQETSSTPPKPVSKAVPSTMASAGASKPPQSSSTQQTVMHDSHLNHEINQFLIEKKDLQNYDTYPIWRVESGGMIHKFELVIQDGVVQHKAVGTYSTWMKSMYNQFQPIKVKETGSKGKDAVLVRVLEEFQPKMPNDPKLVQQYEDDPLVEPFNIYLQVFISQALEPTFLKAIIDMGESFYLDPLNEIDRLVEEKVKQLASGARWKASFKDVLHRRPLMKEIDRPNLKQACQACENSSPPTIKSVLLSGQAYDRTFLTNLQGPGSDSSQEFMIGKVAAQFVRPYHSLYHFKYWLRTRCEAKVKIMKESNKSENLSGESILDKCLENRNWVLQLFDSFKKLLIFEGEPAR